MNNSSLTCPACGKTTIRKLGRLRELSGLIKLPTPGNLYQCSTCGIMFRRPYHSPLDLAEAYSALSADYWDYTEGRTDFALAVSVVLNSAPSGCILDIGCFRGDFLAMFSDNYQKYGIEPAKSACEIARQRGINLIGSSIEEIEIKFPMFNFITLLDVIEHLPYPFKSLQKIADLLLPGGVLIVSTGNTDALPWRLMRQDYWYYFTEHVSFLSPRWFSWAARQLGLTVVMVKKFSHKEGSAFERWYQFAQCLAFWVLKHAKKYPPLQKVLSSIYPFNRVSQWSSPPTTRLWRDHMLVVLRSKV